MLQTLSAGKKLDLITKEELRDLMQEWKADVARGARPISISSEGTADATGLAQIGGANTPVGGTLSPAQGFWWSVVRLAVRTDTVTPAGAFEIYHDRRSPQSLIRDVPVSANGYASFSTEQLMVGNASSLVVSVSGVTAGNKVFVSGAAIEIPEQLLWKWLVG